MTNYNDPKLWKNTDWEEPKQPELLKRTDSVVNRSRGAFFKKDNSEFSKTMSEAAKKRNENPENINAQKQGCLKRDNTYQAINNAKPEVQAKISATMKGKEKTQNHMDKVAAKTRERAKPVIVPWGIYRSGKLAGDAYNKLNNVRNGKNRVSDNIKKGKEGYKFITVEEYILLTGKEL